MDKIHCLKWIFRLTSISLFALFLAACGNDQDADAENTLRIGVTAGDKRPLLDLVQEIAKKEYDLHIHFVHYPHLASLSQALADKEIDADIFQTEPHFRYDQRTYNYHFSNLGRTYFFPLGIYSQKTENLLALPRHATVAIPNEPTNEARALRLLEQVGLLNMKSDADPNATTDDIISNPNGIQIVPLPAEDIADMMPVADIVVLNMRFAVDAGLVPSKDDLAMENIELHNANIIVVRQGEENDPRLQVLLEIFRSPKVEELVNHLFRGLAVPAWK